MLRHNVLIVVVKKLLITSLQFLSNLVTMNERLKLMLWVELFDTSTETIPPGTKELAPVSKPPVDLAALPEANPFNTAKANPELVSAMGDLMKLMHADGASVPPNYAWFVANREKIRASLSEKELKDEAALAREALRRWYNLSESEQAVWNVEQQKLMTKLHETLDTTKVSAAAEASEHRKRTDSVSRPSTPPLLTAGPRPVSDAENRMIETAAEGQKKLQEGKDQLLKRLESYPPERADDVDDSTSDPPMFPESPLYAGPDAPDDDDEDDEDDVDDLDDEEDDSDDEFAGPGDDGRGLLTDIPLILGPNEIEVLPMIVMSGIVSSEPVKKTTETAEEKNAFVNMHTIRCHLLLAQENGRNLLRELLIFVAAWDLREEELYFKFMIKILEAILSNGLMPFAYGVFKEYVFCFRCHRR